MPDLGILEDKNANFGVLKDKIGTKMSDFGVLGTKMPNFGGFRGRKLGQKCQILGF